MVMVLAEEKPRIYIEHRPRADQTHSGFILLYGVHYLVFYPEMNFFFFVSIISDICTAPLTVENERILKCLVSQHAITSFPLRPPPSHP